MVLGGIPFCDVHFVQRPALVGALFEPAIHQVFHQIAVVHFLDFRLSDHRLVRHHLTPSVTSRQ